MTLIKQAWDSITEKQPYGNNNNNIERLPMGGGSPLRIGASVSGSTTQLQDMQAYGSVGWLFAAVSRIAQSTSTIRWHLYRRDMNGDKEELHDHPLMNLWYKPNPYSSNEEFLEIAQQHIDLTGESFWVLLRNGSGQVVEMWPLRPDRVAVIPDRQDHIKGYLYRIGNEPIPLAPQDVICIKQPSPLNSYVGLGPIQSLKFDLNSEKLAAQWTANFFANSAEPGGVIELDEMMGNDDFEKFVARWQQQHKGVSNAHRVAVIERGHWKDVKITQREMQFEQLRRLNRDIILGAFGMPAALLGVSESVNRANAEAAEVMFGRWVIRPRLERIRGKLNTELAPMFGDDLEFDFEDPTPIDRQFALAEATGGYNSGLLTLNEARARLGEGDVEEGDQFSAPAAPASPFALDVSGSVQKAIAPPVTKASPIEKALNRMNRNWEKRLADERKSITRYIEGFEKGLRGSVIKLEVADLDGYDWDWWTKYGDDVASELGEGFQVSVGMSFPDIPEHEVKRLAAGYAEVRSKRLLQVEGSLNMVAATRQRVANLVAAHLVSGEGLGKLTRQLRDDFQFSAKRASLVARTETVEALGRGAFGGAQSQGMDEKKWVTQGDITEADEECLKNEKLGWIPITDVFGGANKDTVPAHPNCRCNVIYRFSDAPDIDPSEGLADDISDAINVSGTREEARCPDCNHLLGKEVVAAKLWCRTCKTEVVFS